MRDRGADLAPDVGNRYLADTGIALMACEDEVAVFRILADFLAKVVPDALVLINQATPDQTALVTRHVVGLGSGMLARGEQLVGFSVIGKRSRIVEAYRAAFFQRRLQKLSVPFRDLARSEVPEAVGAAVERLFGLHDVWTIGIADDHDTCYGNVHVIARSPDFVPPTHLIEACVYQCFLTLSRQAALRKTAASEAKYRLLFQNLDAAFALHEIVLDETGQPCDYRFLDVNPAFEALTGLRAADILDKTVLEVLPGTEPVWIERYGRVVTSGEPAHFDHFSRELDRHYDVHAYTPEPGRFATLFRDVTERKRLDESLVSLAAAQSSLLKVAGARQREAETLREAALIVSSALDQDEVSRRILAQLRRVVPYDTAAVQLLRGSREGDRLVFVAGQGFADWEEIEGTAFDPAGGGCPHQQVLHSRASLVMDGVALWPSTCACDPQTLTDARSWLGVPMIAHDHLLGMLVLEKGEPGFYTERHVELAEAFAAQAAVAIENAGLYQRLQGYADELESRVAARTAELQAHTAHLDAILSSVGDALLVTTADWRIQYVNPAFTALTGYAPGEVAGKALAALDFVAAPEFTWPASVVTAVLAGHEWRGDVVARRKDGRAYDAALIAAPIHAVDGALLGLVLSQRDIGPRKALERTRSQFIADVSHQFRTPVTALKLTAHLLSQHDDVTAWQRRHLDAMQTQLDWLTKLIENTLEITALESDDGVAAARYVVPLADVIPDLVGQFQGQAEAAGLDLVVDPIPDDLPPVLGDIYWLQKAWAKLLENALFYTPEGGQVRVTLGPAGRKGVPGVAFAVVDSGPGIPPEELAHIFERFYRGSADAAGQLPGSGLGLNIAQAVARAHGGEITATSEVGEGSTFTLWLPAAQGGAL